MKVIFLAKGKRFVGIFLLLCVSYNIAHAEELRASFNSLCPATVGPDFGAKEDTESGLLAGLGLVFAEKLVDSGIAAAKNIVNPKSIGAKTSFLMQGLYQIDEKKQIKLNPETGCLIIVVGNFNSTKTDWKLPFVPDKEKEQGVLDDIKQLFPLSEEPSIYIEAKRVISYDRTAVAWIPIRVYVGGYLDNGFWRGSSRGMLFQISLKKPNISSPFYTQEIELNDVKKPYMLKPETIHEGSWGSLPMPSNVKDEKFVFDPFTLTVSLTETPKPYKLAGIFVDSVENQSVAIKTELKQYLDPSLKDSADNTAASKTIIDLTQFSSAHTLAEEACNTSKEKSTQEQFDCNIAKAKSNNLREKALFSCKIEKVLGCDLVALEYKN